MSLTGIVFLSVYGIGLLLTLYNPFYGVALYIFEWHNHPPYMWWGSDWPDIRWSYTIALVTVISWVLNRKKLPPLFNPDYKPVIWLVLFIINAYIVSHTVAIIPSESARKAEILLKYVIYFMIMTQLIRTPKNYRLMIWVLLLCVANFGRMAWEEGGNRDFPFMAPNASGDNAIAAHVMTAIPFYLFTFFDPKTNRWQKLLIIFIIPFCFNLIVLANSRGATLGLIVIAVFTLIWTSGKTRLKVVLGVVIGGLMFLQLTNDQFWERQGTIKEYENDGSAMSRIYLWRGAINMMTDYPLGVGGEGYEELAQEYAPELKEKMARDGNKTVHNTFFNFGTEWGFLGLFFYLGFLAHSFILLIKVKKISKKFPALSSFYYEATAVQLAILGISAAGMFHNRSYAEIVFWLCAFAVILYNMVRTELVKLQNVNLTQETGEKEHETSLAIDSPYSIQ
jgi:probable O-glycosylation ligase (exosortase A-associated)